MSLGELSLLAFAWLLLRTISGDHNATPTLALVMSRLAPVIFIFVDLFIFQNIIEKGKPSGENKNSIS